MSNYVTTLKPDNLSEEFIENYIDCCLIKPKISPSSSNTQMGHGMWKGRYRYAAKNYIRNYVQCNDELPTNVHRIESANVSSGGENYINIVKFPNISPLFEIKDGKAVFSDVYWLECDAVAFNYDGEEWGDAPTKYRSLRFLRGPLYWPYRAANSFLYRFQQHTKISDETLFYFAGLVQTFLKVHQFPPNLMVLRSVVLALPKLNKQSKELLKIINELYEETREEEIFQKVDYQVSPDYYVRYYDSNHPAGLSDNVSTIPDEEKYEDIYKRASDLTPTGVYAVRYIQQTTSGYQVVPKK